MLVAVARIEVLVGVAGKVAKSLNLVLHSMRVNDVHDDGNTVLMGSVDHLLEVLGSTESA